VKTQDVKQVRTVRLGRYTFWCKSGVDVKRQGEWTLLSPVTGTMYVREYGKEIATVGGCAEVLGSILHLKDALSYNNGRVRIQGDSFHLTWEPERKRYAFNLRKVRSIHLNGKRVHPPQFCMLEPNRFGHWQTRRNDPAHR
jgi:hypothetical protein